MDPALPPSPTSFPRTLTPETAKTAEQKFGELTPEQQRYVLDMLDVSSTTTAVRRPAPKKLNFDAGSK